MSDPITLFLCGDVMTGRGIDQALPHPSDPTLYERYMTSAKGYVQLAERANGPIERPIDFAYIWGDALDEFEHVGPDVKIINLETSATQSDDYWTGKGIHYRMHPENVPCITAAGIDCCSLANNHVLDWGYAGLVETLDTLEEANVASAGAGRNTAEAEKPAVMEVEGKGRVLVFAFGSPTSGVPYNWAAAEDKPGVNLLADLSGATIQHIERQVQSVKEDGDVVVFSVHWGSNWGYEIPDEQKRFARVLIDQAGVDIVHGHSSHHVKGLEIYNDRPILYGCGDFINDYEGISGYEDYRDDLGLMYFPTLEPATGRLVEFRMTPTRIKHFRVNRASTPDTEWLRDVLNREGEALGTRIELSEDGTFTLHWN